MSILLRLVLFCCFLNPLLAESQTYHRDTLYNFMIDKNTTIEDRGWSINEFSTFYYNSPNDTSIIIERINYFDKKGIPSDSLEAVCLADIYYNIGLNTMNVSDLSEESLFCFIQSKNIILKYHLPERQAKLSKELGFRYLINGLYNESIDEYLTSIEIHKSLNDTNALFDLYSNIASVYKYVGNDIESQKYWEIIENSEVSEKTCHAKAELYEEKAWQYYDDNQYKKAIKYQQKLVDLNNSCHTTYLKNYHIIRLVSFYIADGKFKKALTILDSLSVSEIKEFSKIDPATYFYYGKVYMCQKKYDDALEAFTKSIELVEQEEDERNWILLNGYEYLSEIYKKQGDESMSLECLEKMKIAKEAEVQSHNKEILKDLKFQLEYYRLNSYSSSSEEIKGVIFQIESLEKKMSGK